jgi:hypothetical protein
VGLRRQGAPVPGLGSELRQMGPPERSPSGAAPAGRARARALGTGWLRMAAARGAAARQGGAGSLTGWETTSARQKMASVRSAGRSGARSGCAAHGSQAASIFAAQACLASTGAGAACTLPT